MSKNKKNTNFLLILTSSLLFFLVILLNPTLNNALKVLGINIFNRDVKVTLLGDVMLGRSVMTKSISENNYSYPFEEVKEKLNTSDIVFANLENPLIENCPQTTTGMIFCAREEMVEGLIDANIRVVTLANNHTKNYGLMGLGNTEKVLNNNGIETTGFGKLVVKKVKGIDFGFLGYNFVVKGPSEEEIQQISASSEKVDVLLVGIHWGNEYQSKPNSFQTSTAKQIVEAGADIIAGHHPHWVQESEKIENSLVYYSLGNFVFDQMWSENTKKGLAVELTFRDGKLINKKELPTYMSSWARPEFIGN